MSGFLSIFYFYFLYKLGILKFAKNIKCIVIFFLKFIGKKQRNRILQIYMDP